MKATAALVVCLQLVVLVCAQSDSTNIDETTLAEETDPTTTPTTTTTATTTTTTKTTKKTTTVKPPNCAAANFGDVAKKCCLPSIKDIAVITDKKDKFCPQTPNALKVFNAFSFNKQQSLKSGLNNSVNFTSSKIIRDLADVARFANCYLTANGAFNNVTNTFNLAALQKLVTNNQNSTGPWVKILESVASTCVTKVNAMNPAQFVRKVKGKDEQVGGKPFFVSQCIAFAAIDACPSKSVERNPCKSLYTLFDQCKGYLFQ